MKIKNLKVAGFRGFNEEQQVSFDGNLIIYSGCNGSGKSSIGEAIEWALFGCTLRRLKGDEISKREFAGCYKNAHYKGTVPTFVELVFTDLSGADHIIRRELKEDETSELTIDGKKENNLGRFHIFAPYDRPLILQHALHDFIHMKPKSRYEVLSSMLGLEDLISFRATIEEGRGSLPKNYPSNVLNVIYRAKPLITKLDGAAITKPVAEMLTRNEIEAASDQLNSIAMGRVPAGTKRENIIIALKTEHSLKLKAQLDWGKFSYSVLPVGDDHPLERYQSEIDRVSSMLVKEIGELLIKVAQKGLEPGQKKSREFLRLGLELTKENDTTCPFCLSETLTPNRLDEIKKICLQSPTLLNELAKTKDLIRDFQRLVSSQWTEISSFLPKLPDVKEEQKILDLLKENDRTKVPFLVGLESLKTNIEKLKELKKSLDVALEISDRALDIEKESPQLPEIKKKSEEYSSQIVSIAEQLNNYGDAYSKLDPLIKGHLSSSVDTSLIELIIEALERWNDIKLLKNLDGIQDKLLDLVRISRDFIEEKQTMILGNRDRQIKGWYDLMNQGAGVGYYSILPKTDALELQARTFDRFMMASPNLSTAQLNCIGLAIALACVMREDSPYRFVLIDDPIQSMDDDHAEAFKKSVIKKLLESGMQVILLTQMPKFGSHTEALYRNSYPDVHLYNIKEYQINGPVIVYGGPEINQILDEVKSNKDSANETYRQNATQSLRKFVERFIKDFYVCDAGASISKRYEDAQWTRLLPLLRQCPRFEAVDEALLKDTHDFTSPFLHADDTVGRTVPAAHQLNPHYDAMKSTLVKYKDILGLVRV